jgi:lysophospholipase L1-like esterase
MRVRGMIWPKLIFLSLLCVLLSLYLYSDNACERIIFLGDSITAGGLWGQLFRLPEKDMKNFGVGGDTTGGVLNRIDSVISKNPSKIFLMIGINDDPTPQNIMAIVRNYTFILENLKCSLPSTKIYAQSVLPVNKKLLSDAKDNCDIHKLNLEIARLAKDNGIVYIDLFPSFLKNGQLNEALTWDGIHLNPSGYALWKSLIEQYVLE